MTKTLEERLTEYWAMKAVADVSKNIRAGTPFMLPAFTAIVGKRKDAVGASEAFGDDDLEKLEWIIAFLGYPCEAEYVTAVTHVMTAHHPDGAPAILTVDEATSDPELQHGVMAWTYCLTTETWTAKLLARFVCDHNRETWVECEPHLGNHPDRLIAAIREFSEPDGLDDARNRMVAADLVVRNNGSGYTVTFMDPGFLAAHLTAGMN